MQFNLILLIGCRVGKRNTGQQAELAGTLNSAGFYIARYTFGHFAGAFPL